MDFKNIAINFSKLVKHDDVVVIGSFEEESSLISYLIQELKNQNKFCSFVPLTTKQSKIYSDLSVKVISITDNEIDIALEFADEVDFGNNFLKHKTPSFIRDKMISQSAVCLVVVVNSFNYVSAISKDVYVEISSFAWQRTILNLQSYGVARIVLDSDGDIIKTDSAHYLARITLDKNMSLDDFEYFVRNIPGVLESGVFLGLADIVFVIDEELGSLKVISRE